MKIDPIFHKKLHIIANRVDLRIFHEYNDLYPSDENSNNPEKGGGASESNNFVY